jgi:phospholipid-binding lipoprotein MlaA
MRLMQRSILAATALILSGLLSACATQTAEQRANSEFFDPYEPTNRKIHEFNKVIDKAIFRPASTGYVGFVPEPMVNSFTSFSDNLSMPGAVVNALLQGDLKTAGIGTARFLINSTVGFAGLADPATEFEIPQVDTDFGETLYVWGFEEGAMVELPFYGPSTTRDAVGIVADFFTNPLTFAPVRPVDNIGFYATVLERLADRGNYSATVDSILYESADSYAQARIIYLQNRRFELAGDDPDAYLDLYDDPYADIYGDPYAE